VVTPSDPVEDGGPDGHPGPATVELPREIRAAIVAHARAEYPNEACGIVVGSAPAGAGGRALRFEPTQNAAASPYRYEIDSADLFRLTLLADDADEAFWAIVHSHVRSAARPSPTDIGLALYPDALYVLCSLAEAEADATTGEPGVRAWRIVAGEVFEVELLDRG
jgi:[CysO sulfur-carrier protein]-S-L-cysteine hydrolase